MNKIKITLSPVFVLFCIVIIFFGGGVLFAVYIASVILHELAHNLLAEKFHCKMDEIKLQPFGAVLYGEIGVLSNVEEIFVAIIGPAFNGFIAILFTALFWLVPELYMYTDYVVIANLYLCLFNLIPVYPLDGGRILLNLLSLKFTYKSSFKFIKLLGILVSLVLFLLYIYSAISEINFSFGIASIFIMSGVFSGGSSLKQKYTKKFQIDRTKLKNGLAIKEMAISSSATLIDLVNKINSNYFYVFNVYDNNLKKIGQIDQSKLLTMLETQDIYVALDKFF